MNACSFTQIQDTIRLDPHYLIQCQDTIGLKDVVFLIPTQSNSERRRELPKPWMSHPLTQTDES